MDQDQNTPEVKSTSTPDSSPFPKAASGENKSSLMLIAACVVVLALVFIGWFMMKQTRTEEVVPIMETPAPEVTAQNAAPADATVAALEAQGTSDEITAIEADITATDFSSLDDTNNI